MKPYTSTTVWRLARVVAARRPHLANGLVRRVAAEKVGNANPLLPLLWIPHDVYKYTAEESSDVNAAIVYDSSTVRYASLMLSHLVSNGLTCAYAHLHRLLDIIISSREAITSLESRLLYDLLVACEAIRLHQGPSFRSMPDSGSTRIFNAVMDKSLSCATYVCDSAAVVSDYQHIGDFALVLSRMGLRSDAFTKRLLREMLDNATFCSPESLMGSLEYLMAEIRRDVRGCTGVLYSIIDVFAETVPQWHHIMQILDWMAELEATHLPFVERTTARLIEPIENYRGDFIGMDALSSRDLCRILGALLQMECDHAETITEAFLSRYIPEHGVSPKPRGIIRDVGKCTLKELSNLLNAIVLTNPTLEGASLAWTKHIVEERVPFKVAVASRSDMKLLFQSLSSLDPGIYCSILRPPNEAPWIYRFGRTNATIVLSSLSPALGPHALVNAVMCYCLSCNTMSDRITQKIVLDCIHIMCSDAVEMLRGSSLITRKTVERLLALDADPSMIVVGPSDSISSPMIDSIAFDHRSKFLYDPSVTSNFKYLKRGENRPNSAKTPARLFWWSKVAPDITVRGPANQGHTENSLHGMVNSTDDWSTSHSTDRESAATLLKAIRHVYQSLSVYHHLGGMDTAHRYDGLSLAGLRTIQGFLKVYDHALSMFSTMFSDLDTKTTMYAIDNSFDSRLKEALRSNGSDHLDSRFFCTPDSYELLQAERSSRFDLKFSDARLRNTSICMFKPPKSKVRLNWSHFEDPDEIGPAVRPQGPRKAANAVQLHAARVSNEVDNKIHGRRDSVEYYDNFVSRHFKDGFAYCPRSVEENNSTGSRSNASGLISSRMHRQVMQEVASVTGLQPSSEVRCGLYHIDILCGGPHENERPTGDHGSVTPNTGTNPPQCK